MAYYLRALVSRPVLMDGEVVVFKQLQPLLLMTYLERQGQQDRLTVANTFWPHMDKDKRLARLSEMLRIISLEVPGAVLKHDHGALSTTVSSDVKAFYRAVQEEAYELLDSIYEAHFLSKLEHNRRLNLVDKPDLYDWLLSEREMLVDAYRDALLRYAELQAAQQAYASAASLALKAYKQQGEQGFLLPGDYERIHQLLLSADAPQAAYVRREAVTLFDLTFDEDARSAQVELRTPSNLPQRASHLIGREADLAACQALIRGKVRLLTVTGPPGIGKTHFSVELARSLQGYRCFRDGVYVVFLEQALDARGVITRIGQALGFVSDGRSLELLKRRVLAQRILLLLDNFEHLLGVTPVLEELLAYCPNLSILVTSRSYLDTTWAHPYPLSPLDYPEEAVDFTDAAVDQYPALKLFLQEATRFKTGAKLTPANREQVHRLVRLTGGLPLAVKLTASWLATVKLGVLITKLEGDLALLDGEGDRHSLYAALSTTFSDLGRAAQDAFTKLAVFKGDFSFHAAEMVTAITINQLRSLQRKSLLERRGETGHFYYHPLIAQFAREVRGQAARTDLLQTYAQYYLAQLRQTTEGTQAQKNSVYQSLTPQFSNIVGAWHYLLEAGDYEALSKSTYALCLFCHGSAHINEGIELIDLLIVRMEGDLPPMPLAAKGWLLHVLGEYEASQRVAQEGWEAARYCNDSEAEIFALEIMGANCSSLGLYKQSVSYYQAVSELVCHETGEYANALLNSGIAQVALGEYDEARQNFEQALALFNAENKVMKSVLVEFNLGKLLINIGKTSQALKTLRISLEKAEGLNLSFWCPRIQLAIGKACLADGQIDEAIEGLEETLGSVQKTSRTLLAGDVKVQLAECYLSAGDLSEAERYLKQAISVFFGHKDTCRLLAGLFTVVSWLLSNDQPKPARAIIKAVSMRQARMTEVELKRFENHCAQLDVPIETSAINTASFEEAVRSSLKNTPFEIQLIS